MHNRDVGHNEGMHDREVNNNTNKQKTTIRLLGDNLTMKYKKIKKAKAN